MSLHLCRRMLASAFFIATTALLPGLASAQGAPKAPHFFCGGSPPQPIVLAPVVKLTNGEFTDQGADCAMWQTFFYLNWPAQAGVRGVPNKSALFGAPGPTVWETWKLSGQVFLPNGAKPTPWAAGFKNAALPGDVAAKVAAGQMRLLTRKSKVSPDVATLHAAAPGAGAVPLNAVRQADGNILYDQQRNPVYYDVAMNQVQFDYIVKNGLYNADTQASYASKTNIVLPLGSIEVKSAWKVLTPAEAASGRFHTSPGYIPASSGGAGKTATVGLVGMHVFASGGTQTVGLWATFYQIDNAPVTGTTPTGTYSFYAVGSSTPINSTSTNPTQVMQMIPDTPLAASVSKQAQGIIVQGNPKAPWQYYRMIDTQWSRTVLNFTTPVPSSVPLATGSPSTATLISPVLETYMQTRGTSCLGCHSYAGTAKSNNTAAGFSFLFGNAKSPKKP
ncbi:MAG: hypothetical protein AB7P37_15440 [Ramlibacter sp.]